jgi:enoyl-CoA hydratase
LSNQAQTVISEQADASIACIRLDRPDQRNSQKTQMTFDLNGAFMRAAHDDSIKVIILSGNGKHFSTGHDLKDHGRDSVVRRHPTIGVYSDWHLQRVGEAQ